jgi:DNA processing protein
MTVGVLGHGIDQIYPPECRNLFLSVREKGLLITEYPPGETPKSGNFPRRNRLIAALSEAVLVIEMGLRSGAQHTVNYAIEQGKEVLAVPGPVGEPMSEGTNRLIQDGAPLVALATDVIQILRGAGAAQLCDPRPAPPREEAASFPALSSAVPLLALYTDAERMLLSALSTHPAHIDSLSAETGLSIPEILVTLLELELRGLVTELPGKRFVRV